MVWTQEGKSDSGEMYANIHESLATTPNLPGWFNDPGVKSVMLPPGLGYWMRTYTGLNFGGISMFGVSISDELPTCVSFYNIIGSRASSLKWGKITIDDTEVAPNCCRLYREPEFRLYSAGEGYVDKCLVWTDWDTFNLDKDQPEMSQVQSYRCGADVHSYFEDHGESSSASGGASN